VRHTDRSSQHIAGVYLMLWSAHGVTASMSREVAQDSCRSLFVESEDSDTRTAPMWLRRTSAMTAAISQAIRRVDVPAVGCQASLVIVPAIPIYMMSLSSWKSSRRTEPKSASAQVVAAADVVELLSGGRDAVVDDHAALMAAASAVQHTGTRPQLPTLLLYHQGNTFADAANQRAR
jgi:hypothetical protein